MLYWLSGNIKGGLYVAQMYYYNFFLIAFKFFIIIFIPTKEHECLHLLYEATEKVYSLQLIPFVHFADVLQQLPWISMFLKSNLSFILKIITNNLYMNIPCITSVFAYFNSFSSKKRECQIQKCSVCNTGCLLWNALSCVMLGHYFFPFLSRVMFIHA